MIMIVSVCVCLISQSTSTKQQTDNNTSAAAAAASEISPAIITTSHHHCCALSAPAEARTNIANIYRRPKTEFYNGAKGHFHVFYAKSQETCHVDQQNTCVVGHLVVVFQSTNNNFETADEISMKFCVDIIFQTGS